MGYHNVHSQLRSIEDKIGLRTVPTELELLFELYAHERLTSAQLLRNTRCSIANFNMLKKRLLDCGLIVAERCDDDGRITYLRLAGHVREHFRAIDAGADAR